jgi:hypothetical protein
VTCSAAPVTRSINTDFENFKASSKIAWGFFVFGANVAQKIH